MRMNRDDGFTLIELLATMMLLSILLTLGAFALRVFWQSRSFTGAQEQIATQLRSLQQQAVSESNPLVFGAWFRTSGGDTDQWGTVRFDPGADLVATGDDECESTNVGTFDAGVRVSDADFADSLSGAAVTDIVSACRSQVAASAPAADFVLFLARGTATGGCVTFTQPNLDRDDIGVRVSSLTGRVDTVDAEDVATECS